MVSLYVAALVTLSMQLSIVVAAGVMPSAPQVLIVASPGSGSVIIDVRLPTVDSLCSSGSSGEMIVAKGVQAPFKQVSVAMHVCPHAPQIVGVPSMLYVPPQHFRGRPPVQQSESTLQVSVI
jgi:hypothetical protein